MNHIKKISIIQAFAASCAVAQTVPAVNLELKEGEGYSNVFENRTINDSAAWAPVSINVWDKWSHYEEWYDESDPEYVPPTPQTGSVSIALESSEFFGGQSFVQTNGANATIGFSVDAASRTDDGASLSSFGKITFSNAGRVGVLSDGTLNSSSNGLSLGPGSSVEIDNTGTIYGRSTAVSVSPSFQYVNEETPWLPASGDMSVKITNGKDGVIASSTGADGIIVRGNYGYDSIVEIVNDGVISNAYGTSSRIAPMAGYFGAAVNIDGNVTGGFIINRGAVSGNVAFQIDGKNILLDLRQGSAVTGSIVMQAYANNTLKLNDVRHVVTNGSVKISSDMSPYSADSNTLSISAANASQYGSIYIDGAGSMDITGVVLDFDASGAMLAIGDILTILEIGDLSESENGIVGTFLGLADNAEFSSGYYTFRINYLGESVTDRVTLEVIGSNVPEPAAVAAVLGAAALASAAYRRRK